MKEPKLTLALAERDERPVLVISRNDNEMLNQTTWELAKLAEEGYMGACDHVGLTV